MMINRYNNDGYDDYDDNSYVYDNFYYHDHHDDGGVTTSTIDT